MIEIMDKCKCSGCSACIDVCPKGAISLMTDSEGFWYPNVDKNLCVNCSLCDKICPIEHKPSPENFVEPKCFAAVNKNLYVRFDSTSGGAFSALATYALRKGGAVGGACTDSDFKAHQVLIYSKSDLESIRSSKYYQSDATGFYREIEKEVKSGKLVLACGAPCQMAGLRNYIGMDYDNLILVDFICLCMPSPKVFKKYIEGIEEKYGSKVISTKAKSKELGWRKLTQMFVLEDGRHIYQTHEDNPFQYFYMETRTSIRPVCYQCPFKGFPRLADITLGDFWGQENYYGSWDYKKNFDYDAGTSIIIANNNKGLEYLEKCKGLLKLQDVELEMVKRGNQALDIPVRPSTIDRDVFFTELDNMSFNEIYLKYHTGSDSYFKQLLRKNFRTLKLFGISIPQYFAMMRYNGIKNAFFNTSNVIVPLKYSRMSFKDRKNIHINANLYIGTKRFKKSHRETILFVEDTASLTVNGDVSIGYGSDIEVFRGGRLTLGRCWMNCNAEIICTNSITIGNHVGIGRNVCIRDNNGGHMINRSYYKDERAVIIEDKVWICSNATIMPGVRIGEGAIIGEGSFVVDNVPSYSMVTGNPAKVVDTDVLFNWQSKY